MRTSLGRATVVGGLLLTCTLGALLLRSSPDAEIVGQTKAKATPTDVIRQAHADYIAALAKGDLDAIMAFWDAEADYIDESGKMTKGKDAIRELYKKALPTLKGNKIGGKVQSVKFLRPEIALEDGTLEYTAPDGSKDSNRYAVVWTKSGDQWLIASARDLPAEVVDLPSLAYTQLKSLEWLVGDWHDDTAGKDVNLRVTWAKNKAFLLLDYTIKQDEAETLDVTVRIGWDGLNQRVRSWLFDSQGGFGEGYWQKDGNKWTVGTSGVLPDGGVGGATNSYEFVDANTFVWKATDREVDGQPLADSEVKFVRRAVKK